MNEFVEECRREWRRLGVPDAVANEMAADLTADLEEAEAEGASAQEVLGSGAFDPSSFAAAWAGERGVIGRPPPGGRGLPRRSGIAAALAAFAVIAIGGAVLVVLASPSAPARLAVAAPVGPPLRVWVAPAALPPPVLSRPVLSPDGLSIVVDAHDRRVVTAPLPAPAARIVAVDINDSGVDTRTLGSVLLIVGLAGAVPLTMLWLWVGPDGRSRPRTRVDDRPSGSAYA